MYDMTNYLKIIDEVIARGPFMDTWESLSEYQPPKWYQDAKFGIFIHWGLYSVPAYDNEWYSRNMYIQGTKAFEHHVATYGKHTEFGYKDFIPMFKAERFDPDRWAAVFAKTGAKYVVPVAEHHDGFQMYRSEISRWNAYEMGPKRDVLGELMESCRKAGLETGASTHRVEHWFFMSHGKEFDSDVKEPLQRGDFYWPSMPEGHPDDIFSEPAPTEEFLQDWLVRTCEIIDQYRPRILYFDWWIQHFSVKPYLKKVAAYYYNRAAEWGIEVAINYKHDSFLFGTAVPDVERGQFADVKPYFWQTDTAMAYNSWCYTENNEYKPYQEILCDLVDIVSKNGNMLLNVGPKADGTFSEQDMAILEGIGNWMQINGEAIYDTKVWKKYGEGPTQITEGHFSDGVKKNFTSQDFRFTTKGGVLYATALKCSEKGEYCIKSLGKHETTAAATYHGLLHSVSVLGCDEAPEVSRDAEGLHIKTSYRSDGPVVFKIGVE